MNSDSHLLTDPPGEGRLPLYEAKMIHQFDHRWVVYESGNSWDVTLAEKADPDLMVRPRYWVERAEVEQRLADKGWDRGWLMGWRDICRATDERTVIAAVIPRVAVGDTMSLMMTGAVAEHSAALLANLSVLTLDFVARVKVGGTHCTYSYLKQFPIIPPGRYTKADLDFIGPRVLELTYTAHDLTPWAEDLVSEWRAANGEWEPEIPETIHYSPFTPSAFTPSPSTLTAAPNCAPNSTATTPVSTASLATSYAISSTPPTSWARITRPRPSAC